MSTLAPHRRQLLIVAPSRTQPAAILDRLAAFGDRSHCELHVARDLDGAERELHTHQIDMIVLDLSDPVTTDGDDIETMLRIASQVPVVVLHGGHGDGGAGAAVGGSDGIHNSELAGLLLKRTIADATARVGESRRSDAAGLQARYRRLSSAGADTTVTAALAGVGPIRDRFPELFRELIGVYAELLGIQLKRAAFGNMPRDAMQRLITRLGDSGGTPRDLIDLHVAALEAAPGMQAGGATDGQKSMALDGEDLLAVQMMGLLVEYYRVGSRRRSFGEAS